MESVFRLSVWLHKGPCILNFGLLFLMILITQMHYKGKNMMLAKIRNKSVTIIIYYNDFAFDCKIQNPDFKIWIQISQSNATKVYIFFFCSLSGKGFQCYIPLPLGWTFNICFLSLFRIKQHSQIQNQLLAMWHLNHYYFIVIIFFYL